MLNFTGSHNSPFVGPNFFNEVNKELFGTTCESELDEDQLSVLIKTLESQSTWFIKRHNTSSGIFSTKCERNISAHPDQENLVCEPCLQLKRNHSLLKAINTEYADNESVQFISNRLMQHDLFHSRLLLHEELQILNTSLEKQSTKGDRDFWHALAIQDKQGLFEDMEVFKGLVKAVAVQTEREKNNKTLSGLGFDNYFDGFLTNMAAMSPAAAKYFCYNLAGRSLQGMCAIRQKQGGQLEDEIVMSNFTKVAGYIEQVGYNGYKYNFANEKMAESYGHLAKFPTNIQITRELAIAESRAHELAKFAGMTTWSVMEYRTGKPSRPVLDPDDSGDPDEGVSVSESAQFDYTYLCVPGETDLGEVMQHTALSTAEQQETEAQFGHIDVEHEHEEISSKTRISIANLLNPIVPATSTNPETLLDVRLLVTNPDGDQILNNNLMLEMRQEHDSANIGSHSGNQKKKKHAPTLESSTNSKPRECSKLVSLILKEKSVQSASLSRMHRWNIHLKFNLSNVRNTSTNVSLATQLLATNGAVSKDNELIYGKFAVVIKDQVCHLLIQF
ncbi:hypothetical protein PGT21_001060 [Puccinia graminis f. sp. tritici]|uniref:Uncharacterized protein n=1 Tax=Puccinia graminis f. sp. tritici TaxID=56615 RepID=A0A5B0PQM9_PUCGR|nr:hypothetical protein PGT21_001060 [Puccinia graminis f. sp. tritici]